MFAKVKNGMAKHAIPFAGENRQIQGAQISRNEAYFQYAAMTRQFAATKELAIYALEGAFCDAIKY